VALAKTGESVGSYRLLGAIGSGGMGVVYVAEHLLLGRRAAIKFLHPHVSGEPEMVERFFNEARAASAVKHPGIVEVYDFGYLEGAAYLVMEYLDGESLLAHLRVEGTLRVDRAITIVRKVAAALTAAHDAGVVHRDLKPDNIFLVRDAPDVAPEARGRVCLLDFGVAKLLRSDGSFSASATASGVLVGTPAYMSPEQCKGGGQIDGRSDLYSLGCVLYGMLAGRPPFVGEGGGDVLAHHIFVVPEPPSAHSPGVPPELDAIVMRLLEKDPARRFQSARELGRVLGEASEHIDALDQTDERQVTTRAAKLARASTPPIVPLATPRPGPLTPGSSPTALAPLLEPTTLTPLDWLKRAPRRFLDDKRIWMPVAGAGVLLLLLALILWGGGGDRTSKPEVPAPARPGAATSDTGADPAPPSATVEIVITSIPSGAMVIDQANGERLGPSPFRVRRPAAAGVRAFVLQLDGFEPEVVSIRTDVSSEAQVVLDPLPSATDQPPPTAPPPTAPPPTSRPRPRPKRSTPPAAPKAQKPGDAPVGDGSLDPFDKSP
jgi:eukaryotic-like serine/threonine-protein kinase